MQAQYIEIGIFSGLAGYNGDLAHKTIQLNELHPAVGVDVGLPINNYTSIYFQTRFFNISGDDANSIKPAYLVRNLNFHSNILEAVFGVKLYLLGYNPVMQKMFSPYITSGISIFHFNPKTEFNGETYDLQKLGTEGQGTTAFPDRQIYSLTQFSIPIGAGIKYAINRKVNISLSLITNKTFTDYLDDVSTTYVKDEILIPENGIMSYELSNRTDEYLNTDPIPFDSSNKRGNDKYKDWYGTFGITLCYSFIGEKFNNPAAYNLTCPKF